MIELLCLVIGVVTGIVVARLFDRHRTGHGFFKIDSVPDEDDFYTINVRLDPNQKLNEKNKIVLTRE